MEFQSASRIDDHILVNRSWRNVDRTRTWCQDDVFGFDDFYRAIRLGDFDFLAGQQLAVTLDGGHTVGFEQGRNAGGQAFDDVGFTADHRWHVHGHASVIDTVDRETVLGFVEFPRTVQQGLGWNAADVQAGTAQSQFAFLVGVLLDAGGRKTQLGGLDGSHVAARARADHYYVKFLRHSKNPL
ncbi:hypothetical protein D9M73_181570 [compost metagenome]